jgi:membrane fusion protein (multidrug efflux system)
MNIKILAASLLSVSILTGVVIHFARADADDKATSQPSAGAEKSDDDKPTATVATAPLRAGDLAQTTVAFGSVTAQPGMVAIFSVPYECRVKTINVSAGQPIDKSAALVEIEPSPAAKLAISEAQSNLDVANKDLAQAQQRFDMKLSTNSDLLQSQQAVQLAKLRLDNLTKQGAGEDSRSITADSAGLIAKIDVQQGQVVPAGNPLIETIAREQVEVRLGVEPSEVSKFTVGQDLHLFPNNSDDSVNGKIRLITQRVNPDTRLVDVFVTPEKRDALLLDGFVRAEIVNSTKAALIAPRNAVLPDDEGLLMFTIKDGHAVKHIVTTGVHNNDEVAVTAEGVNAGDAVVVQGNLELEDGMLVTTEGKPEDRK